MKARKVNTCFIILLMVCFTGKGQNLDSLRKRVESSYTQSGISYTNHQKSDSLSVKRYLTKATENMDINSRICFENIEKAIQLSLKIKSPKHISQSIEYLCDYYMQTENFDKAVKCCLICLKLEEKFENNDRIGSMYARLGFIYNKMEQTHKAMEYLDRALQIFQNQNDTINIALTYSKIGRVYFDRNFWEKSTPQEKDKNYEISLDHYKNAIKLLQNQKNPELLADQNVAAAYVYNALKQYDKAEESLLKSINIFSESNKSLKASEVMYVLGTTCKQRGEYEKAINYYSQSLDTAKKYKADGIHWIYEKLAEAYYGQKNYKMSHDMYIKYINLRDSALTMERSNQIIDMETKYQTEKKEQQISGLLKQKKLYGMIAMTVVFSLLLLILSLYLRHKNTKAKKLIAEQKIDKLEQEKQLVATQAILDGETAERTRLARDLHDGLGGMLSAVKINLFNMKQGVIVEAEDVSRFNRVMEMLDKSMQELRRVAHNMMPETLSRYGLKVSLEDLCNNFQNVHFHFFGNDNRLEPKVETTIYRIIYELVNNAVRHAQAENINVQIIQETERVSINVQDDGKGFDTDKIQKGAGLENIKNRVNSIGGMMHILSSTEKGAEITIDIDLNQKQDGQN